MTTAAETLIEHTIDADTLAPLLDDRERVCEVFEDPDYPCGLPATWAVSLAGPCRCDNKPDVQAELWCDRHARDARILGAICTDCLADIHVTWMERL